MKADIKLEYMKAELDEMMARYDDHDCHAGAEDGCDCAWLVGKNTDAKKSNQPLHSCGIEVIISGFSSLRLISCAPD